MTTGRDKDFARRTLDAIGRDLYREDAAQHEPIMAETSWVVGRLSEEGIERLATFLSDLTRRAPLPGLAWTAHREVLEALEGDLRREIEARHAEQGEAK